MLVAPLGINLSTKDVFCLFAGIIAGMILMQLIYLVKEKISELFSKKEKD